MNKFISLLFVAGLAAGCGQTETVDAPTLSYAQDLRTTGNGPTDCSTVYCLTVECPEGFERVFRGKNDCCGTCVESNPSDDGYCNQASQCEGLVHIQCVGDWACVDNACEYSCDTTELQ